ncbi:MAG: type II toxin-antitoxin system PemK/MazF family toxin [Oscillospiraceae bacterium]|nr:type II toxin-antitoxin system PemK/MazF family toxin [Oscillospiraceae bacterium]
MRHSDIKVGCIYYVDFDPHKKCEFNGKHLALVLRKNNDNNTLIVLPLTSSGKGLGNGKIELGTLICLPMNLQSHKTYAVVNSIRTVNCSRFSPVFDGGNAIAPKLDNADFRLSLRSVISDITYNTDERTRNDVFKNLHMASSVELLNNLLYRLLRQIKSNKDKEVIVKLKKEILDIMNHVPYKEIIMNVDDDVKVLAKRLLFKNFFKIILTSRF